ncbi:MAG: hypothetical protein ACFCVA_06425 [Gammaproteobacteria bacterium]
MSEYQYYEFQALDRRLTQEQIAKLRHYSSRAQITPSSFVNVYNWGDFKGEPKKWVQEYFDAFLYLANWGSRWFMLRVPKKLLEPDALSRYCAGDALSLHAHGDHVILSFRAEIEAPEWVEGEGCLGSLLPLRGDLVQGDHRCLYLGWLLGAQQDELQEAALEPPVPPGLSELNAPLQSLVNFLGIDEDLIAAAAECSEPNADLSLSRQDIVRWLAQFPAADKDAVLTSLLEGENPHAAALFRQRALRDIRGAKPTGRRDRRGNQRSVAVLLVRAEEIAEARMQKEAEERARAKALRERELAEKREAYLKSLVGKEQQLWVQVEQLIAMRMAKPYDQAVTLLRDLRDLADRRGTRTKFSQRMSALYREHAKKSALAARLQKAQLVD